MAIAVQVARLGDVVEVVLAATPFYVEAGGQISDTGAITGRSNDGAEWRVEVSSAWAPITGLVVHEGRVTNGRPTVGDAAVARVDARRRWDIMRNHTATHLFHHELRQVLGDHVLQQGSLVAPDRMRFDFNHPSMVSQEQLSDIERRVNQAILENYLVSFGHTSLQDAKERGAMALFGEKYGQMVRTVQVGGSPAPYSLELCGGTHVNETAEIGLFHIVSRGERRRQSAPGGSGDRPRRRRR